MDKSATSAGYEQQVVDVVRALALEVGGPRAMQSVTPTASFEREIGFGSLERVELLIRLEAALGHELGERVLQTDTPRELAIAAADARDYAQIVQSSRSISTLAPAKSIEIETLSSVADALWKRAEMDPTRVHVYLESETEDRQITFGALRDAAATVAAGLLSHDVQFGERIAIMLPTGFDFLKSFMGVMAAGMVPVPLYPPPRLERLEDYLVRQSRIIANSEAKWLITVPEAAPIASILRRYVPSLAGIISPLELADAAGSSRMDHARGECQDTALIQYTSGSTADPKGVRLSHANLLANIRAMGEGLAIQPTDVGVSWLPLYHDMGLIGTWLTTMVHGIPLSLMSPLSFLARPERWLWTIHERKATLSAAPNFAYELCIRKIRDEAIEGLDLSSWRCAINGAEPVSASTIDRFTRRFAPYGFRATTMMPVYGLAECSVALTFPPLGREPIVDRVSREAFERDQRAVPTSGEDPHALSFVAVGQPLARHEIRLTDDNGREVPDRVIGRLAFRGPSAMTEYFNNPVASAATIKEDGWLDSGDLAYRVENELFITGRAKDLIIKGGRNIVPQEIEEIVGSVPGVRKGCVVAFGSSDRASGTEKLIIVAESANTQDGAKEEIKTAIIERVATLSDLPPDIVQIVKPGIVPKTSSGKIRRSDTKQLFESSRLGAQQPLRLDTRVSLLAGRMESACRMAFAHALRAAYATYVTIAGSLAAIVIGIPVWILIAVLPGRRPSFDLARFSARVALRLVSCRVKVEGAEHFPPNRPLILVSNHASYADAVSLIATLPMQFLFVAKKELNQWPLVGMIIRKGGHPTVDRWDLRRSIEDAGRITEPLSAGEVVLFFPEGTMTRAKGLRPFKMGAFTTAAAEGCPVVPIALRGTRKVLPSGSHIPRPGPISIWIGEPLIPSSSGWGAALELRDSAWDAIAQHCGE